ncbi:MAG TPA: DUF2993 domain-containing protein [Mycobacteriales bacterium]|nr:DUF2993 domain-containing protein [Mycobacteriales bacterium]
MTSLLVLAVLLVAADRVTVRFAERTVAEQAQTSAELGARPGVTIHGFPFFTQAVRGRYARIDVSAEDLDRGGVRVSRLDATLRGVQVPLSEAMSGSVSSIAVESLDAKAVVTFADLAHRSRVVGLTIEPEGEDVRLTGRVRVLGQTVSASALSRVSLRGGRIAVTARSVRVLGQTSPALVNALAGVLDLLVPVGRLPYDLELTGLSVTAQGVLLRARSGPTVLSAP